MFITISILILLASSAVTDAFRSDLSVDPTTSPRFAEKSPAERTQPATAFWQGHRQFSTGSGRQQVETFEVTLQNDLPIIVLEIFESMTLGLEPTTCRDIVSSKVSTKGDLVGFLWCHSGRCTWREQVTSLLG